MSAVTTAWQAALAAEHQAAFGYGLLGPRLAGTARELAVTCADAHRSLSDTAEQSLAEAGVTPMGAKADYPALYPVPGSVTARRLALRLEDDCAAAWRYLYSVAAGEPSRSAAAVRATALDALTASAVRGVRWRTRVNPARATTPFPGI